MQLHTMTITAAAKNSTTAFMLTIRQGEQNQQQHQQQQQQQQRLPTMLDKMKETPEKVHFGRLYRSNIGDEKNHHICELCRNKLRSHSSNPLTSKLLIKNSILGLFSAQRLSVLKT
uniref:Uncharacterized protein n=1 Tax=Glossina pallidipes TaxID=7398 RepID=A0A1B0A7X8_GLOPL